MHKVMDVKDNAFESIRRYLMDHDDELEMDVPAEYFKMGKVNDVKVLEVIHIEIGMHQLGIAEYP